MHGQVRDCHQPQHRRRSWTTLFGNRAHGHSRDSLRSARFDRGCVACLVVERCLCNLLLAFGGQLQDQQSVTNSSKTRQDFSCLLSFASSTCSRQKRLSTPVLGQAALYVSWYAAAFTRCKYLSQVGLRVHLARSIQAGVCAQIGTMHCPVMGMRRPNHLLHRCTPHAPPILRRSSQSTVAEVVKAGTEIHDY